MFSVDKKMAHPALGRIQKYLLRKAFDGKYYKSRITGKQLLPDKILYREKEQFADGLGSSWVSEVQKYASELFPGNTAEDAECLLYQRYATEQPGYLGLKNLIQSRQARRRQHAQNCRIHGQTGRAQPTRWYPIMNDPDLNELISKGDAVDFIKSVLGWTAVDANDFTPSLESLNKLIVSMLERVPFHNLTLLTRPRRPPTMSEIKNDMMLGIGGPCAVVNAFFAVVLDRLGFGPSVYLLR